MINQYTLIEPEKIEPKITLVADAIREKFSISTPLAFPNDMVSAIESFEEHDIEDKLITKTLSGSYVNSRCSYIRNLAFHDCTNLTSVNFPKCTNIGPEAFYYCRNLTTISFPECTSIGDNAFQNCFSLLSVDFPVCKNIGGRAFSDCSRLMYVNLPQCTIVSDQTFRNCSNIQIVNLPKCKRIGISAFSNCYNLTSINASKCEFIHAQAFNYCYSLSTISFLKCISIYSNAFTGCSNLESIYFNAPYVCAIPGSYIFAGNTKITSTNGSIFVNASMVDAYKSAQYWSYFSNRIFGKNYLTVSSVNPKNIMTNITKNITVTFTTKDETTIPTVNVTSNNESIVSVSDIVTTTTNTSFNIHSYDVEGTANITITIEDGEDVVTSAFDVNVFASLKNPLYNVDLVDGATYTFELNDDDFYENNNKYVKSSNAICKLNIIAPQDTTMYLDCINYTNSYYDYGVLSKLDTELLDNYNFSIYYDFYRNSSHLIQTVSYEIPSGEHFIYIKFIKSVNAWKNNDSLQFKIRFE